MRPGPSTQIKGRISVQPRKGILLLPRNPSIALFGELVGGSIEADNFGSMSMVGDYHCRGRRGMGILHLVFSVYMRGRSTTQEGFFSQQFAIQHSQYMPALPMLVLHLEAKLLLLAVPLFFYPLGLMLCLIVLPVSSIVGEIRRPVT